MLWNALSLLVILYKKSLSITASQFSFSVAMVTLAQRCTTLPVIKTYYALNDPPSQMFTSEII